METYYYYSMRQQSTNTQVQQLHTALQLPVNTSLPQACICPENLCVLLSSDIVTQLVVTYRQGTPELPCR